MWLSGQSAINLYPNYRDNYLELYDLVDDPEETVNLVGDPQYRDLLEQLQGRLNTYKDESGWSDFFYKTIDSLYFLGPLSEDEDAVFRAQPTNSIDLSRPITTGNRSTHWKRLYMNGQGYFDHSLIYGRKNSSGL